MVPRQVGMAQVLIPHMECLLVSWEIWDVSQSFTFMSLVVTEHKLQVHVNVIKIGGGGGKMALYPYQPGTGWHVMLFQHCTGHDSGCNVQRSPQQGFSSLWSLQQLSWHCRILGLTALNSLLQYVNW